MAPHGFIAKVHNIDVREGGGYKMSFTNFTTMKAQSFGGKYLEVKPNELLENIGIQRHPVKGPGVGTL